MSKKVELKYYDNSWYNPGNFFVIVSWYFINQIILKNSLIPFSNIRKFFLKLYGSKIGNGVVIKPGISVKYPWKLQVGNNSWIGENVWIDNLANVYIGNNVCISQGAMLICGNHNYKKSKFDLILGEIKIDDGVWVGAKSVVCPGVRLKSHCVLTVSSVANKDLDSFSVYMGNPAKKINNRKIG